MPEITQTEDGRSFHHEFNAVGAASWYVPEDDPNKTEDTNKDNDDDKEAK